MTSQYKQSITLVTFALLFATACGGTNTTRRRSTSRSKEPQAAITKNIAIVQATELKPQSDAAVDPLKNRGDAFYLSQNLVFRGATSGLLIGELENGGSQFKEQAQIYLPGAVNDILVQNHVAFAACGPSGVAIIDVSSPKSPVHVATIDTQGAALKLAIERNILVIADGAMGLVVVDIENPMKPQTVSLWPSTGYVRDVAIKKRHIYVAEDRAGVRLLKLKLNGEMSTEWKYHTGSQARSLFLGENNRLYVANGPGGVLILDVSGRKKPEELGRLTLKDTARDIAPLPGKSRVFVANGDDGVIVINTTDPANLSITGTFTPETPANRVFPIDNRLYVGNDSGGLLILDISDPDSPSSL